MISPSRRFTPAVGARLGLVTLGLVLAACAEPTAPSPSLMPPDALCRRAVPVLEERVLVRSGVPLETCGTGRCFNATNRGYWRVDHMTSSYTDVVLFREADAVWSVRAFAAFSEGHAARAEAEGLAAVFTAEGDLHLKLWDEPPFVLQWNGDLEPDERVIAFEPHSAGYALLVEAPCGPDHDAPWRRWVYALAPEAPLRQMVHEANGRRFVQARDGVYSVEVRGTTHRIPATVRPVHIAVQGAFVFVRDPAQQTVTQYAPSGAVRTVSSEEVLLRATVNGLVRYDPAAPQVVRIGATGEHEDEVVLKWGETHRLDGVPLGAGERRIRMEVKRAEGGYYLVERVRRDDCQLTDQLFRWYGDTGELIALTEPTEDALFHPQAIAHEDAWVRATRRLEFIAP